MSTCAGCGSTVSPGDVTCQTCGAFVTGGDTVPGFTPPPLSGQHTPSPGGPVAGQVPPLSGPGAGDGSRSVPAPGQGPVSFGGPAPGQGAPTAPLGPAGPTVPPQTSSAGPAPRPRRGKGWLVAGLVVLVVVALAAVGFVVWPEPESGQQAVSGSGSASGGTAGSDAATTTCPPDATEPRLVRYWQDGFGLHVVITIVSTCDAAQVLDDPQAQFGLFLSGDALVTGTFDLSSSPVRVPAAGESGEIELVFDSEADLDFDLRTRVFLPSSPEQARGGGFTLRYRFVCRPSGDDGAAGTDSTVVNATAGADLGDSPDSGDDTDAPVVPDVSTDAEALTILQQIHAADAPVRTRVANTWVPQVSGKRLDGEVTPDFFLDNQPIAHTPSVFLNRFWAWEDRYDGAAFLLRGSDFPSICGRTQSASCRELWIVAVEVPLASGPDVFYGWCEDEGLNRFLDGSPILDTELYNCVGALYSSSTSGDRYFAG